MYVDCEAAFLNANRDAIVPSLMRDALHPTAKGTQRWFDVVMPTIRAILRVPAAAGASGQLLQPGSARPAQAQAPAQLSSRL